MTKLLTTLVGIGMIPLCSTHAQQIDPKSPNLAALSKTIIDATNAIRAKHGLHALSVSDHLNKASQMHTDDMGRLNFFSHQNPHDRSKHGPGERVTMCGYQGGAGENIVYNWLIVSKPETAESMTKKFMDSWMKSPGHRNNILHSSLYKDIGASMTFVADPEGTKFKVYGCQVFGTPHNKPAAPVVQPSAPPAAAPQIAANPSASLLGYYEHHPVTNDWHKGNIESGDNGKLHWKNAGGVSWSLELRDNALWTGKDCPYGEMKYELKKDKSGKVIGFVAGEALYSLLKPANAQPVSQAQPAGDPNAVYYDYYYVDANKTMHRSDAFTSSTAAYNQLLGRLGVDELQGRFTHYANRAAAIKAGKRIGN